MSEIFINKENMTSTFDVVVDEVARIIDDGGTAKVKITKSTRSLPQNALFHAWCNEISQHLTAGGRDYCTPEWVKQALKATFLGSEEVESVDVLTGKIVTTTEIRRSHKLDKGEMCFFLTSIQGWALDINLILSAPIDSEYQELINRQNT